MGDGSMIMSFRTLNCPSNFIDNNLNKQRAQFRTRSCSSSILLQTDVSGVSPVSKQSSPSGTCSINNQTINPLRHANGVGIIGGVSAIATLNFLEKLVKWSSKDGEESIPFVVYSDPLLNKEQLSQERSPFNPSRKNADSSWDHREIVENLRQKKVFLEQSGACCIAMPCHISHAWHNEISEGSSSSSVPFLHVGECVAKELRDANLKPLEAGSNLRIGVLATDATLRAGFYQEKLQSQGFEVVLPDKATMEHTIIPAMEALSRKDMEGARNLLRIALQVLLVRAVNAIVLASDDMQGLLPQDDPLLRKCIDPMDALARSAIELAQKSTEKVNKNS